MDIQYFGANCIKLTTKSGSIVIDDNLKDLGLQSPHKANDIALFTSAHAEPEAPTRLIIDTPGEYEVANISIQGIPAQSHLEESGQKSAVMYRIISGDIRLAVTGHIYPELSDDQ